MDHAGPFHHGNDLGVAHAVSNLLVAGRVEKHRPHHSYFQALYIPVVINNIFENSDGRSQHDHHHFGIFGAVAFHNFMVGPLDLIHRVHGSNYAPLDKAIGKILSHLAFHRQIGIGESAGEVALLEVGLIKPVRGTNKILQKIVRKQIYVFQGMRLNKPVTDHHKRQHDLAHFSGFKRNRQQIV